MITQILKKYDFCGCRFTDLFVPLPDKFLLKIRLISSTLEADDEEIFGIPGTLSVHRRILSADQAGRGWGWNENYASYPDKTGYVPILEASMFFDVPYHPERTELKLGIPLTLYDIAEKDLFLLYDGKHMRFIYDGIVINENFTCGELRRSEDKPCMNVSLANISISSDIDLIECSSFSRTLDRSIQYYSPAGHSAWAGDVVNFWHDGVYHLYFLYDHHHHGNRWWGGVHYFYHLTTSDFKDWVDHGAIFEIEENWQAFGTGTPFFYDGRFWYAIGYHTGRSIPDEYLYRGSMIEDYRKNGYTEAVSHEYIRSLGMYPSGANLAVSNDGGYTFTLTHKMFHWAENPSVYTKEDGTLFMCVGDGIWESASPEGPWKLVSPGFPPSGKDTALEYTAECPSFFEKNGYKYIIMGIRGYWRTEKNGDVYTDCAQKGEDIYDGLVVPMAVNAGGRLILAGWINGIGWGSVVVHRELIQYEDGRLGMKWLSELQPDKDNLLYESETDFRFSASSKKSFYFETDILPSEDGSVRIVFGDRCELRLDSSLSEIQIGPVGGNRIKPVYQRTDAGDPNRFDNTPSQSHNFTLPNAECLKIPYTVRIIQYYDRKMNSVIIDAEIGGCRTIVSNRTGESWESVSVMAENDAVVSSLRVYSFDMEGCI